MHIELGACWLAEAACVRIVRVYRCARDNLTRSLSCMPLIWGTLGVTTIPVCKKVGQLGLAVGSRIQISIARIKTASSNRRASILVYARYLFCPFHRPIFMVLAWPQNIAAFFTPDPLCSKEDYVPCTVQPRWRAHLYRSGRYKMRGLVLDIATCKQKQLHSKLANS